MRYLLTKKILSQIGKVTSVNRTHPPHLSQGEVGHVLARGQARDRHIPLRHRVLSGYDAHLHRYIWAVLAAVVHPPRRAAATASYGRGPSACPGS